MDLIQEEDSAGEKKPIRIDFEVNIAEGLVFRQIGDNLGSLFFALATGHVIQLFINESGVINRKKEPAYACWRLRRTGEEEARQYYSTVYHIEEITGREDSLKSLIIAVSHEGERPWLYKIPHCQNLTHASLQPTEIKGVEIIKKEPLLSSLFSSIRCSLIADTRAKVEAQVDYCRYLGNNLLCAMVTDGLKLEARIIDLVSRDVVATNVLKELERRFTYTVGFNQQDLAFASI